MNAKTECNTDPDAPHGFDRSSSHAEGRYVCECEGWQAADLRAHEASKQAMVSRRPPMTPEQIAHLVAQFHRTRHLHGNGPEDIVRAVEAFHGIHAESANLAAPRAG